MTSKIVCPALLCAAVLSLYSCGGSHTYKKAENAQDAGREFIRASLDGDYEKAYFYMYADSTNQLLLTKWKKGYDGLTRDEQQKYKDADIRPIAITPAQGDTLSYYTYANSYKKDTTTVKIVKVNGEWLVDLKEILNAKK